VHLDQRHEERPVVLEIAQWSPLVLLNPTQPRLVAILLERNAHAKLPSVELDLPQDRTEWLAGEE
jgi:hypothetical protein